MKRLITIMAVVAALFAGCKQNDVDPTSGNKVTITNEKVTNIDQTSVVVSGTYSFAGKLDGIYVLVSTSSDMANAKAFESVLSGKDFAATVTELKEDTKYYYKYRYVNMGAELESEAVKSFSTLQYGVLYVTTLDVTEITGNSARCGGEVTYDGGYPVTARGVCWSTSPNPTISDSHTTDGSGTGSFTSSITGLTQATTYYVRAYATNEKGTGYGELRSFTTKPHLTITVNGVSFDMIYVEGGTFTMGATSEQGGDAYDDEKPTHSVTLDGYYIGEFEVTQELWQAVMGSNPSYFNGNKNPVEQVSWDDCQDFIRKLNQLTGQNFRLPTEAEWEYAAREGNKSNGYKYSGSNNISDVAWYTDNSGSKTHAVGTKSPNELGIYDMSGNVLEWCQDWYGSYGSGSQTNPTGSSSGSGRVLRGGSWFSSAWYCRVSFRGYSYPDNRDNDLGFRLVL